MLTFVAACMLPAFLISWAATWGMRWLAPRCGLIDQPAARKVHQTPTPLGGGIAIYLGLIIPLLAAQGVALWLRGTDLESVLPLWFLDRLPDTISSLLPGVLSRAGQLRLVLGAGTVLAIMGIWDDRFGLSWKIRLGVQLALAIMLVAGGVRMTLFTTQHVLTDALTVIWIVLLINSLNFLDNMDGLTGGIGLIASTLFAWVMLFSTSEPHWLVGGCLLVLGGAIGGFFVHNAPPARIFMGDAGSTLIGLMLACLTVLGTFYDEPRREPFVLLAPLCILAIPLYDFFTVMTIRIANGHSPFHPDKNHFSHRLTDLGLTRKDAVRTIHFATLTTGLGALLLYHVEDWTGAWLVIAIELCMLVIVSILETTARQRARAAAEKLPPA